MRIWKIAVTFIMVFAIILVLLKTMKPKRRFLFVIQVLIPIIAVPLTPYLIKGSSGSECLIIGLCVSTLLFVWEHNYDSTEANKEAIEDRNEKNDRIDNLTFHFDRSLKNLEDHVNLIETFVGFSNEIDQVQSPYFRQKINSELKKMFGKFKSENKELLSGYIETDPYSVDTFGVEGISYTKHKIEAVSSINDYWDRTNFVDDYLLTQYSLVENQSITITRIFVGNKEHLKSLDELMKDQCKHGINVYYMETDSIYFLPEWKNEDFLIQDGILLVNLKSDSHQANSKAKEIISERKDDVESKVQLFNQMFHNATKYKIESTMVQGTNVR